MKKKLMKSKFFMGLSQVLFLGAYFTGARATSVWIGKRFSFNNDLVLITTFLSYCLFLFVFIIHHDFLIASTKQKLTESEL